MSDAGRPAVIRSVSGLSAAHGPLALSVGVFDGLHVGHAHLLAALVARAQAWHAKPGVVTFDAHPDAVLRGEAPPLLLDPADRERLLAEAGIEVIAVEHFDERLRTTPYDVFVRSITDRVRLAGFVMTPDAAFGHERRGTPDALRELGARSEPAFEVAVVPPFAVDGRPVSSSEIRRLVAAGQLAAAEALLGRPYAVTGRFDPASRAVRFDLPVALPPPGKYAATVAGRPTGLTVAAGAVVLVDSDPRPAGARLRVEFADQRSRASNPASVGSNPHAS